MTTGFFGAGIGHVAQINVPALGFIFRHSLFHATTSPHISYGPSHIGAQNFILCDSRASARHTQRSRSHNLRMVTTQNVDDAGVVASVLKARETHETFFCRRRKPVARTRACVFGASWDALSDWRVGCAPANFCTARNRAPKMSDRHFWSGCDAVARVARASGSTTKKPDYAGCK